MLFKTLYFIYSWTENLCDKNNVLIIANNFECLLCARSCVVLYIYYLIYNSGQSIEVDTRFFPPFTDKQIKALEVK